MRLLTSLFLLTFLSSSGLSQTTLVPVIFIVTDFDTDKEIVGALVTVRQTALTQPTVSGGKVRFENVPVGEIEYFIVKEGYQFTTGRENVSTDTKTNVFRVPMSKIDDKEILVTGEVSDSEGHDVEGALVEIKVADQIRTVKTDDGGNYSAEVTPSSKYLATSLRIEVKKGDCKKTETVEIPRTNVVYKDLKLECLIKKNGVKNDTTRIDPPVESFEIKSETVNGVEVSVTKCELVRNKLTCYLQYENTSTEPIKNIKVIGASNKFTDSTGLAYKSTLHQIGNVEMRNGTKGYDLIKGTKVKGRVEFIIGDISLSKIATLKLVGNFTFYDLNVIKK